MIIPSEPVTLLSGVLTFPTNNRTIIKKYIDNNRDVFYGYLLSHLTSAIDNGESSITLFQFEDGSRVTEINRDQFQEQLTMMMNWYVSVENYESAGECRDLIRRLVVNTVLDQSM